MPTGSGRDPNVADSKRVAAPMRKQPCAQVESDCTDLPEARERAIFPGMLPPASPAPVMGARLAFMFPDLARFCHHGACRGMQ